MGQLAVERTTSLLQSDRCRRPIGSAQVLSVASQKHLTVETAGFNFEHLWSVQLSEVTKFVFLNREPFCAQLS